MTKQEFDIAMTELAMQRDEVLARNIERIDQIKKEQQWLTDEHFKKIRELDDIRRKIDGENRTIRNMFNQQKLELLRQMETGVEHYDAGEVEP